MQFLSTYLGDNKMIQFGVLFGVLIVAVLLLWLVIRLAFGRRLRAGGGGRGRQPRLGVVDAYHDEMLDIIAPHDDELALAVEVKGVDDAEPGLASAPRAAGPQPPPEGEADDQPEQQHRRDKHAEQHAELHQLIVAEIGAQELKLHGPRALRMTGSGAP